MPDLSIAVHRFDASRRDDFFRLHSEADHASRCFCVGWWVDNWEGWSQRTTEQNRALRESLLDRGEYDGYLLYVDGEPVGWCQVGPRDRLGHLVRLFGLAPDPDTWAISCFQIAPQHRRQGLATHLLQDVLRDLRERGVARVQAFPRRGEVHDVEELWNGPESMLVQAGFRVIHDHPKRPVLGIDLLAD